MSRRKRTVLLILAGLALWYFIQGFIYYRYQPVRSSAYLWGVYHVHSRFSDGLGELAEIAAAARRTRTDFVILTDHGSPNPRSALPDRQIEGVRIIGGYEAALPEGHLMVFGERVAAPYFLPPWPPDAIADVHRRHGLTVVAYPHRGNSAWQYWESGLRPDGLEVFNGSSHFRDVPVWEQLQILLFYPFSSHLLLKLATPPTAELKIWDRMNRHHPVQGFYAANAHGGFKLLDRFPVPAPSYTALLGYMGLGVDRRWRRDPLEGIRRGEFFSLARGAGEPSRFIFQARQPSGGIPAGSPVPAGSKLELSVHLPGARTGLRLFRDGELLRQLEGSRLELDRAGPGVYRAEVHLPGHPLLPAGFPWILSNPVRVGETPAPVAGEEEPGGAEVSIPLKLEDFRPENTETSMARYAVRDGCGEMAYRLVPSAGDPRQPSSCTLAAYRRLDLDGSRGILLEAESSVSSRFHLGVKAEDRFYYASIRLEAGQRQTLAVPFSRFYEAGRTRVAALPRKVSMVSLSVNSFVTPHGQEGRLAVYRAGFYR